MKIKFDYNENNESDLFVKKAKKKGNSNKKTKIIIGEDRNNIAKKISLILFITLLIIILIFIILFNIFGNEKMEKNENDLGLKNDEKVNEEAQTDIVNMSLIFYNKTMSRIESLSKGRKYIDKCLKDNMTQKCEKVENPIISVIIPVFNCEKSIKYAISSIQNQNITNLEIILINDFSTDNSLNIFKIKIKSVLLIKLS